MPVNRRLLNNPILQRMPKTQREWTQFTNELAKWAIQIAKVGDGTIVTSAGATVTVILQEDSDLETLDGDGLLTAIVSAGDGSGYLSVARGPETGSCRDGVDVTFSRSWTSIPIVRFTGGGVSFSSTLTGSQAVDFQALDVTGSGFTPSLKIKELVGTTTTRTDPTDSGGSVSDPSSPTGLDYSINKDQSAEAWDDKYTFQYDVTVTNFASGAEPGTVSVGIYTHDGSNWVQRATRNYVGNTGESSTTFTDQTVTVTVDALGLDDDFGINIESGSGSITFDNVTYETATAPTTESATPSGAPDVEYMVLGG